MESIVLKVKEFKKMADPTSAIVNDGRNHTKYVFYAQANSIPREILNWMDTNPRKRKFNTTVAETIRESLNDSPRFHELNRGIILSCENIIYDNQSDTATITFIDSDIHGNIDGGHTLETIIRANYGIDKKGNILEDTSSYLPDEKYVFFEVFTGLDNVVDLAAARNTSSMVDTKSIEELKGAFKPIKEIMINLPFHDRIFYKMNEDVIIRTTGTPIDVREIIAIINMFNQDIYPISKVGPSASENHPIQSYTGKEVSLRKYIDLSPEKRASTIHRMRNIIPIIFDLFEKIETEFPYKLSSINMRYGSKKYSKYNNNKIVSKSLLEQVDMSYVVPRGIIYPILGGFRSLIRLDEQTNDYYFEKSPLHVWETLGPVIAKTVIDDGQNPEYLGKSNNIWTVIYLMIEREGYKS